MEQCVSLISPLKVNQFSVLLILLCAAVSCKPSYLAYVQDYRRAGADGLATNTAPDYGDLYYWAAHPQKRDPSDSIPAPLKGAARDTVADVFFIHPTTLTDAAQAGLVWNASVNNAQINAKTDYSSILYQASVFNSYTRVYAPRYRQAHIHAFYTKDTARAIAAFDTAYADVRNAFLRYVSMYNQGRPFIIASHSQGTLHAARLLREVVEKDPVLLRQLVCAYLPGLPVTTNRFAILQPCTDSTDTGCFMSWRTYRKNYMPAYVGKENPQAVVTNPLTWRTDGAAAPASLNKGAVLFNFNKVLKHTNGAVAHQGVLWIRRPRFAFSFLSSRKNYHPGDINLFYLNIRENTGTRIQTYQQGR